MPELGGYVYAIGIEGTTLVKIGRTYDVENRLRGLQSGIPYRLVLLHHRYEEDPGLVERQLHTLLCASRVKYGEWFNVQHAVLQQLWKETTAQLTARLEHLRRSKDPHARAWRAQALEVTTDWLLGLTGDPEEEDAMAATA
jgi:hypothetical protein